MHRAMKRQALACALVGGVLPLTAVILIGISFGEPRRREYTPPPPTAGELKVSASQRLPLEVRPDPVSLGRFAQGQSAYGEFRVVNAGSKTVRIERAQPSCTCLNVGSTPACVGPGEEKVLTVSYDPADAPEFAGGLSVELVGLNEAGRAAFETHVEFEVSPPEEGATPAVAKSRRKQP